MDKVLTEEQTKQKALRILEFRSHSEKELRDKLFRAGGQGIDSVIEFCRKYNLLNDESYALSCARDLQKLKKYGKNRIAAELKNRGISDEYISAAISELDEDESDTLLALIKTRLKSNFDKKNIDKIIRYFLYRGYNFADIKRCIEQLKSEEI